MYKNNIKRAIHSYILKLYPHHLVPMLRIVRSWGGSTAITLPKQMCNELDIRPGMYISISRSDDHRSLRVTPTQYSKSKNGKAES